MKSLLPAAPQAVVHCYSSHRIQHTGQWQLPAHPSQQRPPSPGGPPPPFRGPPPPPCWPSSLVIAAPPLPPPDKWLQAEGSLAPILASQHRLAHSRGPINECGPPSPRTQGPGSRPQHSPFLGAGLGLEAVSKCLFLPSPTWRSKHIPGRDTAIPILDFKINSSL